MGHLRWILRDVVETMDAEANAEAERSLGDEARRFLGSLDPDSQEGMWFDAFADGFPSRLAAALVYVRGRKTSSTAATTDASSSSSR